MATLLSSKQNSIMFPSASGGGLRRSLSQPKFAMGRNSSANSSTASLNSMIGGGLKRSGSSSRLMGSTSNSHFEHFTEPLAMASTSSPDFTAGYSTSTSRRKAPSVDSESSSAMSLDSDYDGSTDSEYAPGENPAFPAHYQQYHQYYSTDNLDTLGLKNSSYSGSPTISYSPDRGNSETTSRPQSPIIVNSEDDTAVRAIPSRHVDYLSHDWREEDIWSSWKYVVSRRGEFSNSARLENASWRTWMKSKNKLKTVSPETLNWLKESDVTWLYGPLQTGSSGDGLISSNDPPSAASTTKPILKKRSKSEVMLQRSLSASSLVMQATAAIEAQQTHLRQARPILQKNHSTGYLMNNRRRLSIDNSPICPTSLVSSGVISPSGEKSEKRRIHFNEQVTQCIAIDERDEDDDEPAFDNTLSDNDDDEGVLTIRTRARRIPLLRRKTSPVLKSAIKKTISMLPSTTLKSEDAPHSAAMKHTFHSPAVLPSSSREDNRASTTLSHSKKSGRLLTTGDEDDDDEIEIEQEEDISISASNGKTFSPRKSGFASSLYDSDEEDESDDVLEIAPSSRSEILGGMGLGDASMSSFGSSGSSGGLGGLKRSTSTSSLGDTSGMRRSSSGMVYMPYDLGTCFPPSSPSPPPSDGFLGQLIDIINTARDIAHVIWNAGRQR
ncbi:hypothetical protein TD95_004337 [Thielaviopsis punctulata]|uniref:Nitrogen regulatory protein areA GATA-like domain-containing protein n=1 Tax=Thielaviopsis punctulata TaxID=72032 RepID=A0A0F4ZI66_9PEZI|nr:hypothetical protein TD95_004337 [Thielaviopsis punctulata]